MWRSIFVAVGVMAIIVGFECLVIDSATLYSGETRASAFFNPARTPSLFTQDWRPKEWLPWVLLSSGTITVLYAFTLPKRWHRTAEA